MALGTLPVIPVLLESVSNWSVAGSVEGNDVCRFFESRWSSVSAERAEIKAGIVPGSRCKVTENIRR
jgi:hypothetical protein